MHPGLEAETLPGRIVVFAGHLLEAHFWSYAYKQYSWPKGFAGLLHGEEQVRAKQWQQHSDLWEYVCAIESAAKVSPGLAKLREKVFFMDRATTQLIFRLLDHIRFQQNHKHAPQIMALIRRGRHRIGDSVAVEKSAKIARKAEQHDQEHQQVGPHNLLHQLRRAKRNPLAERGIREVAVPDIAWDSEVVPERPWSKMVHPGTQMDDKWGADACLLQGRAKPYKSPGVTSRKHAIMALRIAILLCKEGRKDEAGETWQACAVAGQSFVKDVQTGRYIWVLASAADGLVSWEAKVLCPGPCFVFGLPLLGSWNIMALTDVRRYESVPHIWVGGDYDVQGCGFLYMVQTAPSVPLVVAALCRKAPRLLSNQRAALVALYRCMQNLPQNATQQEAEIDLITKLLGSEEAAKPYIERCNAIWFSMIRKNKAKKDAVDNEAESEEGWSSEDEIPPEIHDHLIAAVHGFDPNQLPERDKKKFAGASKAKEAKELLEKFKVGMGGGTGGSAPEPAVPLPAPEPEVAPGAADPFWERRSNQPWVRPFVPNVGADFTASLSTGAKDQVQWVARYFPKNPDQYPLPDDVEDKVSKTLLQKTVTASLWKYCSEHAAFLAALEFIWARHELFHAEISRPPKVKEALAANSCCGNSVEGCKSSLDELRKQSLADSGKISGKTPKADARTSDCCDVCGVRFHTSKECPLMQMVLASDAKLTTVEASNRILSSAAQLRCKARLSEKSCASKAFKKVAIKGDGNCFFTATAVGIAMAGSAAREVPTQDTQLRLGRQLRANQLVWMKDQVACHGRFPDESGALLADAITAATGMQASAYFAEMEKQGGSGEQTWGGFLEAAIIGKRIQKTIYIFQKHANRYVLLCQAGPDDSGHDSTFLVWTGNHFDTLLPTEPGKNPVQ
jgi:hypothetical protein